MNSVLAVAHSPRRIAMMFVAGLIILWFFIPRGDDFTPSFRHNYALRGDCYDGNTPHNGRCLNGLYPTGGYFLLQLSISNEYPIYDTMLILLY